MGSIQSKTLEDPFKPVEKKEPAGVLNCKVLLRRVSSVSPKLLEN